MSLNLPKGKNQIEFLPHEVAQHLEKTRTITFKKCPVITAYIKNRNHKGPFNKIDIPLPDENIMVKYDAMLTLEDIESFWITSAIQATKGNITKAAMLLGSSNATIYKRLRKWRGGRLMYTRAGRPSAGVPGNPLVVKDLNMEGSLIKTYTKAGKVPNAYFQVRSGVKVQITKEEFKELSKAKK